MKQEIQDYINQDIGKHFESHGGGIKVHSIEGNILKLELAGKCSSCPSAMLEVEEMVEEEIKKQYPEIEKVVVITEVSDDLLNFAKKILAKN